MSSTQEGSRQPIPLRQLWHRLVQVVGTVSIGGLILIAIFFFGEIGPRVLNGSSDVSDTSITNNMPSELNPGTSENVPTVSEVVGQIRANIEEDTARALAKIEAESQARLEGVGTMLRSRERLLDGEVEGRLMVLRSRLDETSRANWPNIMTAFFAEFGCMYENVVCPVADASTQEIVDFFDRQIMNAPEFKLIFDNDELKRAAGYDPETKTWDNGSRTYLQD